MVGVVGADPAGVAAAATGVATGVAGVAGTGVEGKAGVVVWLLLCWLAMVALGIQ